MTEMHAAPGSGRDQGAREDPQLATVSVEDLLDRRVPLEWFESVAIVAGLCSTLVDTQTSGVPASAHIVLTADGTIALAGRGSRHEDDALPRVLHELLAVVPPPTALRLFVLHATSSEGDRSPAAFGKSLEYYERPGRADIIRAVRQKYFETPIPLPGSAAPEPFALPPKPAKVDQQPLAPSPRRRRWLVAACLGVGAGAAAIAVAGAKGSGRSDVFRTVDAIVTHAAEASRDVAGAIAASLAARADDAAAVSQTTEVPPPVPPARKARPTIPSPSSRRSDAAADQPSAVVRGDEPSNASTNETPVEQLAASAPGTVSSEGVSSQAADEATPSVDSTSTVVPPRLLEPIRLPSWVDPVSDDGLNAIELEIGIDGTVERIRMLSPAMRLTDMMILSAAKTWLFEPASIEGRPVPYRLTLSLAPNR